MANEVKVETVGEMRKREGDFLYAVVLLFTYGQMALIVWEMFALIPGFAALTGIQDPARIHSSREFTSMYLGLVGIYLGRNALRKYSGKEDAEALPHYVFLRISRGYFYMGLWCTLSFTAFMLKGLALINRLPQELIITTLGVMAAVFGDKAINGFITRRTVRQLESADAESVDRDKGEVVMEYLEKNRRITNKECRKAAGVAEAQATNILQALERDGRIEQVGDGKYTYYRQKGTNG